MNKIYKVIWNRVRHCYVVVSEIAKNHGKEHSTNLCVSKRLVALTLAIGLSLSSYAFAAEGTQGTDSQIKKVDLGNGAAVAYDNQKGNLTIGDAKTVAEGTNKNGKNNTTIGTQTDTLRNVNGDTEKKGQPLDDDSNTVLVDGEGKAHNLNLSTEAGGSTAVGYQNKAEGDNSTAIGNNAKITNKPVTYYVDADGNKTASVDNAAWYKDASGNPTKVPQVFRDADDKTTATPQYCHTYTGKDPDTGEDVTITEITSDAAKADKDSAGNPVYNYKKADNTDKLYSVTLYQAASNSIAAGTKVTANGSNAVAVGYNSTADNSAVAIGDTAAAAGYNTIAIGTGSTATDTDGTGSIAIGKDVKADKTSTAVGLNGTKASSGSSAYGNNAVAENSSSAFGSGVQASVGSYASGMGGTSANFGGMAVGNNVSATNGSYATGMGGTTATNGSMAVGANVHATSSSFASGRNGTSAENRGIAYGDNVHAQYGGFAAGTNNTSASSGVAVGSNVHAYDGSSYAGGMNGTTADGSSVAVGDNVHAAGGSYAAGMGGTSASSSAVAIGNNAYAYGGSYAFGSSAHAESDSTAIGSSAKAKGGSYAFGSSADADNSSYAIGNYANARSNSMAIGSSAKSNVDGGIALGSNSTVYRGATAGLDPRNGQLSENTTPTWKSTYGALSIGTVDSDGNATGTRQIIGVAAGTNDTDAVNVAQLKQVAQGFSIHDYSVNSTTTAADTNYNNAGATGSNALAAGVSASATGDNAVAIGYGAQAEGKSATAIGKNGKATGQYAMAFGGLDTKDEKGNPVTVTNTASGNSATAFGQGAQAKGNASLAFGRNTVAGGDGGSGQQSVAFGEDTQALGGRSLAFGEKTIAKYNDSVAFGNDTRASSTGATAFGNRTRALSSYSTAWGNATVAADEESTAWGTDTIAGAKLDENGAVTNKYTEDGTAKTEQMDVHGNLAYIQPNGKTAGIKQMKIDSGGERHDYVVLAGKDGNTYVRDYQGSLWKVNVDANGTATVDTTAGKNGKVYNGNNGAKQSLAKTTVNNAEVDITPDNVLTKAHEGTNGYTTEGYANATAFGYSTEASGNNATAFGNDTKASAAGATAFGYQTVASGENATAFGENSIAAAKNSLAALGGSVSATATNAAAIGKDAKANLADSVALGSGAVANRAKYSNLTDAEQKEAYAKGTSTGSAWEATDNAIAVGNDSTVTRQITGVAAGSFDTDAVNVAQLKAVDARHTTVSVGGQKATADNTVFKGGNLEMTRTTSNGQANYDVSLSKDVVLGEQEENKGGSLVVNSLAKFLTVPGSQETYSVREAVKIDGTTVSVVKNDGTNDQRQVVLGVGQDTGGYVALFEKTGKTPTYIFNAISHGITYLKDSQANEFNRLEYGDITNGSTQFIATLDDGLKFSGDQGTDSAVKLNQKLTVTGGETNPDNLATANNIGVVSSQNGDNGKLEIKLNKDLNLGNNGSVKMGNTTINNGGVTIQPSVGDATKSVSLTNKGLDNGGNKITHVAAGEISDTSTDAVNGSQLNKVKTLAGQHTTVEAGSKNISVTESTNDAGGKKYIVDLAKDVTFGDAAKGDKTVAISGTDGTITAGTGDNKITVDGSKGQIVAGGDNGIKIGNIKNGDSSLTIYDKDGKATDKKADGGKFVTNLDNKTWKNDGSYVSGRAATEDQLHQVESNVNKKFDDVNTKIENVDKHHTEVTVNGGTAAPIAENTYSEGNLQIAQKTGDDGQKVYDLKLGDNLNIGGAGKDGAPGKDGHIGINGADGKSGVGVDGKNGISIKGKDGQNGVTIKGVDGKDGTEGHIGLTGPKGADGQKTTADIHVKNGQVGVDGTDGHGGKDGMDRVVYEDHNHVTHEVATMDDGMK